MKPLKYVYGAALHTQEQTQFIELVKMSSNPIDHTPHPFAQKQYSIDPVVFRDKSLEVKLLVILQGQKSTPRFSTDT